jgi:DNA-binding transcriptional MerR regulator
MRQMTIGEFAQRSRLSAKALRLYDQLGLVVPASTDPVNGYRFYRDDHGAGPYGRIAAAAGHALATIGEMVDAAPREAVGVLGRYWAEVEATSAQRRVLVGYLQARLEGAAMRTYDVQTRRLSQRRVLSINRHLHAAETDTFFDEAFARLRAAGRGLEGIDGARIWPSTVRSATTATGRCSCAVPSTPTPPLNTDRLGADV